MRGRIHHDGLNVPRFPRESEVRDAPLKTPSELIVLNRQNNCQPPGQSENLNMTCNPLHENIGDK